MLFCLCGYYFYCYLCQPAASIQLKYQLTTSGQK